MLEVKSLGVSYGSTRAVDGLDLNVGPGEAAALLGANGAGKTSTLRALSRLIPSDGTILFDGVDVTKLAPEELARRGLVHVPEGRHVFATLSVHENLLVGQTSRSKRKPLFTTDTVYDLFPALAPLRKRTGWQLSGGEQQMVAIGRALLSAPRLLMLDEPSLGLAPILVRSVYQALKKIKSELPMLLVEQNAALALDLCDRGYVLLSGKCVLQGTAGQLSDREALITSYLGHSVDDEVHDNGSTGGSSIDKEKPQTPKTGGGIVEAPAL
jgi:branched-chain amino acid transport system ATP-binding protein